MEEKLLWQNILLALFPLTLFVPASFISKLLAEGGRDHNAHVAFRPHNIAKFDWTTVFMLRSLFSY